MMDHGCERCVDFGYACVEAALVELPVASVMGAEIASDMEVGHGGPAIAVRVDFAANAVFAVSVAPGGCSQESTVGLVALVEAAVVFGESEQVARVFVAPAFALEQVACQHQAYSSDPGSAVQSLESVE